MVSGSWVIDPLTNWVECYHLEGHHYRPAFSGGVGRCESRALPGFWLQVEWLWQDPLPETIPVLRELGLI